MCLTSANDFEFSYEQWQMDWWVHYKLHIYMVTEKQNSQDITEVANDTSP